MGRFSAGKTLGLTLGMIGGAALGLLVAAAIALQGAAFVLAGLVINFAGLQVDKEMQIGGAMAVNESVAFAPRPESAV